MLWFAIETRQQKAIALIYNIIIDEAFRQRGYGKQAMQALEVEVQRLGVDEIRLHVFGNNTVARKLYQNMGYEETNVMMRKVLG